jgi:hypothetical protein
LALRSAPPSASAPPCSCPLSGAWSASAAPSGIDSPAPSGPRVRPAVSISKTAGRAAAPPPPPPQSVTSVASWRS